MATVSRIAGKDITDGQARDLVRLTRQLLAAERKYDAGSGLRVGKTSPEKLADRLRALDSVYVGSDGSGRLVGVLSNTPSRLYENANTIGTFVVDRRHRGKGLGRALLMQAIRDNVAAKRKSTLWVSDGNEAGMHLYGSVGFRPASRLMVLGNGG